MSRHQMDLRRRRAGGFSLIEVAISMGILAIAGLGAIGLMAAMTRANRDARLRSEAATLARHTIEELVSLTQVTTSADMFSLSLSTAGYHTNGTAWTTDHGTPAGTLKRRVKMDLTGSTVPVQIRVSWDRSGVTNHLNFTFNLEKPPA